MRQNDKNKKEKEIEKEVLQEPQNFDEASDAEVSSENTSQEDEQAIQQEPVSGEEKSQNVYQQVLEKLEIVPDAIQDIQAGFVQESPESDKIRQAQTKAMVEKIIKQDFLKVENLVRLGLATVQQGQVLKNNVLKKAFDVLVQNERARQNLQPEHIGQNVVSSETISHSQPSDKSEVFREFESENPDFFSASGRKEVLEYLKSDSINLEKDELRKISEMIENVEKTAVDRYIKQTAYEKNLVDSNELAKQRLTANAQKSGFQDKNAGRIFTREQIGKMSSAEFAKYEPLIMEQLKKGFIR